MGLQRFLVRVFATAKLRSTRLAYSYASRKDAVSYHMIGRGCDALVLLPLFVGRMLFVLARAAVRAFGICRC